MAICPQRAIEVGGPGAAGTVTIHGTWQQPPGHHKMAYVGY
jgi:hypothetical protein